MYFQHSCADSSSNSVAGVFKKILGNDPNNPGNPLLGDITISPDFPNAKGKLTCADPSTMAAMRDHKSDNPTIILCDPAALGHGGIGKSYGNVPKVTCASLDPRVSWRMDTLGSVLLHEYTHWEKLVVPPLTSETDDLSYGPYEVRFDLDKDKATNNADSYTWLANEVLWTTICTQQFGDPKETDGDNPNCDGNVCTAPRGGP